jgi:hypothetical protein
MFLTLMQSTSVYHDHTLLSYTHGNGCRSLITESCTGVDVTKFIFFVLFALMKCVFCIAINTKLIHHINNVDSDGEHEGTNVKGKQCVRQPCEVEWIYPWNCAHKQAAFETWSSENGDSAVDAIMTVHRRRIIQMW